MRLTATPATRLVRALTALVTVWCLGCSGFEPLVERMLGREIGMACGAGEAMSAGADTEASMQGGEDRVAAGVSPASERTQPTVATAREDTPQGYSCGCQSCYSSSPTTKVAVTPAPATPDAPVAALATLFGIARQPLVPPPQRAL